MKSICGEVSFRHSNEGSEGARTVAGSHVIGFGRRNRDSVWIACDSQLFNRTQLVSSLGLKFEQTLADDSTLILAAYEKWSEECVEHLVGEFAFVIWDERIRRVFCCRDHMGSKCLFYWYGQSRFIFATNPEGILRTPRVPRTLNRNKLAAMAVPGGIRSFPEETFYSGVYSIRAGSAVSITEFEIRKRTYWQPRVLPGRVPLNVDDALEELRNLLYSVVEDRIGGLNSVGALLSGGLDSSSLVSIAVRSLSARNLDLTAIAGVLPQEHAAGLHDEREFVEEFRGWNHLRLEYVSAPAHAGPFDRIHDPPRFYPSFLTTSYWYMYDAIQRLASSRSLDLILDGVGGELGPTNHARVYSLELALRFKWVTLIKELRALKSTMGISPLRELGTHILNALSPSRLGVTMVYLAPEFARPAELPPPIPRVWPSHHASQLAMIRRFTGLQRDNWQWPIPHSYPFLDKRIIEFCLSAPGHMKMGDGYTRLLIRRCLEGILPPRIQWRTGKIGFSPDYSIRFNRQLEKARSFVAGIGPNDPVRSVVDVETLQSRLRPGKAPLPRIDTEGRIPTTIYLICFLRQFAEFRV